MRIAYPHTSLILFFFSITILIGSSYQSNAQMNSKDCTETFNLARDHGKRGEHQAAVDFLSCAWEQGCAELSGAIDREKFLFEFQDAYAFLFKHKACANTRHNISEALKIIYSYLEYYKNCTAHKREQHKSNARIVFNFLFGTSLKSDNAETVDCALDSAYGYAIENPQIVTINAYELWLQQLKNRANLSQVADLTKTMVEEKYLKDDSYSKRWSELAHLLEVRVDVPNYRRQSQALQNELQEYIKTLGKN